MLRLNEVIRKHNTISCGYILNRTDNLIFAIANTITEKWKRQIVIYIRDTRWIGNARIQELSWSGRPAEKVLYIRQIMDLISSS